MALIPLNILDELKAAARTKNLVGYDRRLFSTLRAGLFHRRNKIRYALPKLGRIPRNFVRQEPWEIEYLYSVARGARQGIVETGRFNGGSVLLFAAANQSVPIHSIDIEPQDDEYLKSLMDALSIGKNVNLIVGDSQNVKYPEVDSCDLLFVDGDHSFEGCTKDLENWWPSLSIGGHLVVHDCYLGCEVQDAMIEFLRRHEAKIILPPNVGKDYWRYPMGSFCHLVKVS